MTGAVVGDGGKPEGFIKWLFAARADQGNGAALSIGKGLPGMGVSRWPTKKHVFLHITLSPTLLSYINSKELNFSRGNRYHFLKVR